MFYRGIGIKRSGAFDKFFPAFGAGNGDFPFSLGDTNHLLTFGAGEIAVVPILQPVDGQQKPAVFLIPLIGIPAEAAYHRPDQHGVGAKGQGQIHRDVAHEHPHHAQHQTDG